MGRRGEWRGEGEGVYKPGTWGSDGNIIDSKHTPDTIWSWMRPPRGLPSLGTRY